jgi:hypothetical protein
MSLCACRQVHIRWFLNRFVGLAKPGKFRLNPPAISSTQVSQEPMDRESGVLMTRKLTNVDRAAVDLLFDRIQTASDNGNGGDGIVAMAGAVPDGNIQAVEKVLSLLSEMPAPEPPADLATRTLHRLAKATGTAPAMPATPFVNPNQPMA